ncbi:MAG: HAMP domain-containing protein [Candidatus Latescibacteria bacterium]|nr:HAMP domain-containing protein [Candidatus Latescibacterota bacterium]NIO56272.1 HAMP domain-containing protein [Candidatus Latescibacterota bacterium]
MANPLDNSNEPDRARSISFTKEQARAVQEALTHRPRISIRLRIALGFLITFIFTCGITIAAMVFISTIAQKLRLLEKAGTFEFEIQQARRFEKNWFLYGTNLYDALNNVQNAENLLNSFEDDLRKTISDRAYETMSYNLARYKKTLEDLDALAKSADSLVANQRLALESELRHFGAEIVTNASNAVDQERLRIHTWLNASMVVALAALFLVLILVAIIAAFIARQILRPFGRFEQYTRRIAAGDFSLITPARKYRDEFTNLAIALNHMMMEFKDHEEQLISSSKMAAVGNLTAGIAHELNNPLNNISLTTEALIDEFDKWSREKKLEMLNVIFSQVERAGATVANLLDFTRRDEISFEELSINEIMNRTLRLVGNEISLSNVQLELELGKNLPRVKGNADNLQQVFLNLLLNAIQAMPDGGKLRVKSYVEDNSLKLDVSDTGIGITRENLDKVFDPFFTTKEVGKGTGLGLSVSYGIIKKHRGVIAVESEVGKGTTFSITLPCSNGVRERE